jgi:hypothetical protein
VKSFPSAVDAALGPDPGVVDADGVPEATLWCVDIVGA